MTSGKITSELIGEVTLIRFNDPATSNALSMDMVDELSALVLVAERNSGALILSGNGRAFCSGANLATGALEDLGTADAGLDLERHINPLVLHLRNLKIPLITAVHGAAAGVGASLALMGDIIVAGTQAYFLQAFCRIGLVPDGGSPWLLARAVGRVRALELMLLGEKLPARDAYAWGLITRLVPDDEVDRVAMALATRLAQGPRAALGLIRQAAWSAAESTLAQELELERQLQTTAGYHDDFREGVTAFLAKRPPQFNRMQD